MILTEVVLDSSLKIMKQNVIIISRIMKVQGQRYILSILVLLQSSIIQQSKSSDNVSNQISDIPFNTTTHIGNKFFSSFSSWIIDSGVTDHICSSLSHFTSYHQINPISVKLPNENKVFTNYSESVLSIKMSQIMFYIFLTSLLTFFQQQS